MPFCQLITIEHNLLRGRQRTFFANINRVLPPLHKVGLVIIRTFFIRHRLILLFDAAFHLLEEFFAQGFHRGQHLLQIPIFGIEVADYFRVFLIVEVVIIIDPCVAVNCEFFGFY